MAANPNLISVQEYLTADYETDYDYVDGVLEDRNVGEHDHSRLILKLGSFFLSQEKALGVRSLPDIRFKISDRRYRVPDFALVNADNREQVLTTPPLLCVEVLSPEDRMSRILIRVADYHQAGVPTVWIINPRSLECFISLKDTGLVQVKDGFLTALDGRVSVNVRDLID